MTNDTFRWRYEFSINHVYDGDTIYGELDFGLNIWLVDIGIRFYGINAPALNEPGGQEAKQFVTDRIQPLDTLTVDSYQWDKYARRVDGIPYLPDGTDLCQALLDAGLAVPYPAA